MLNIVYKSDVTMLIELIYSVALKEKPTFCCF